MARDDVVVTQNLVRKFSAQGHAVPHGPYNPRSPFSPDLLARPQLEGEPVHSDSLHEALDATRMFRCKECREILMADELSDHTCEEM